MRSAAAKSIFFFIAILAAFAIVVAGPTVAEARPKTRDGDILRIFDKGVIYVVTNDDAVLADRLLENCRQKERRVLSLAEWNSLPDGARWYVSTVFLINRQNLPAGDQIPKNCTADGDEVWTQVVRMGRSWGIAYDVTISAPDGAWLRQAIDDFRALREAPRSISKRNVQSVAVVPFGLGTGAAAEPYLRPAQKNAVMAHLLPGERYESAAARLTAMDEVLLVDRSSAAGIPASVTALLDARPAIGPADTAVWRERKASGRWRIVFSSPNRDLLAEAVRRYPNPLAAPETPVVVSSARDLRSVRRVAVACLNNGVGGRELPKRLASLAASRVRALDAFEVLERAGLSEVLSEIALDQAGITAAGDRAKVRQLAAADALLIVEVNDANGRTDFAAKQERLTDRLAAAPPPRPLEPSRLRYSFTVRGKENDPGFRIITEGLLGRVIGTKTDREYRESFEIFTNETLPRWQDEVDSYWARYRSRPVSWRQTQVAKRTATISGSLRLVDLTDGLVLWESPFSATEKADEPGKSRSVTTIGEDSSPPDAELPPSTPGVPDDFLLRAADAAIARGVQQLRGTALLPANLATAAPTFDTPLGPAALVPSTPTGRVLDIDGDTILIGLGSGDGLKNGDAIAIALPGGGTVRAIATKVRPRTCDAIWDKSAAAADRAKVEPGQSVAREVK